MFGWIMDIDILKKMQPFLVGSVFLVVFIAEHIYPQRKDLMDNKHDFKNMALGVLNAAVIFGIGFLFQKGMDHYNGSGWGIINWLHINSPFRYLFEFFILDLFMYWWHRLNHGFGFLWRFHHLHHTDKKMNTTTALRFHTVELILSYVARLLFFPFVGISIVGFVIYGTVFSAIVMFHHSNFRMPMKLDLFLRKIIVTPHMHRIHHSILRKETDSNYSSVFSFWDQLFNSYHKFPEKEIEFGTE